MSALAKVICNNLYKANYMKQFCVLSQTKLNTSLDKRRIKIQTKHNSILDCDQIASFHIHTKHEKAMSVLPLHICQFQNSIYVSNMTVKRLFSQGQVIPKVPDDSIASDTLDTLDTVPLDNPSSYYLPDADVSSLTTVLEPSLASQSLGGYLPAHPGPFHHALHYIHVDLGLPWWGSIATLAGITSSVTWALLLHHVLIRPYLINQMNEFLKQSEQYSKLSKSGDSNSLHEYIRIHIRFIYETAPTTFLIALHVTMLHEWFFELKRMVNLPVESMKTGGILWFSDLTLCDPTYGLPILTLCATFFLSKHFKAWLTGKKPMSLFHVCKHALLFFMLPLSSYFPSAIWVWWLSSTISMNVAFLAICHTHHEHIHHFERIMGEVAQSQSKDTTEAINRIRKDKIESTAHDCEKEAWGKGQVSWVATLEEAKAKAKHTNLPIMLVVHKKGCPLSKQMGSWLSHNIKMKAASDGLIMVQREAKDHPSGYGKGFTAADGRETTQFPLVMFFDPKGRHLSAVGQEVRYRCKEVNDLLVNMHKVKDMFKAQC